MPVRQYTHVGMGSQIGFEPLSLRRTGTASTRISTVGIQCDQMPGANIVAIVPFAWLTGRCSIVAEVTGRASVGRGTTCASRSKVLMIPYNWMCNRFDLAPAEIVRLHERIISSAVVLVISQRQDGSGVHVNQQI